ADCERPGIDVVQVLPCHRHRHGGPGQGPGGVGRGDGAVSVGLVEVHEDLVPAFLLPPGGGDQIGKFALQATGDRDHAVAHVQELIDRLDTGVDVQAA